MKTLDKIKQVKRCKRQMINRKRGAVKALANACVACVIVITVLKWHSVVDDFIKRGRMICCSAARNSGQAHTGLSYCTLTAHYLC